MQTIQWGIIGCGDVTEVKSGPAFQKVEGSSLVAVMRRDAALAEDFARRHQVPKWYSNAQQLINDPDVNAIYIATPPSSHEMYALAALQAGKPVYVEKPMTVNAASARRMAAIAAGAGIKMVVAHYRREQPLFKKVKQLLQEKAIGEIRFARIDFRKALLTPEELLVPKTTWRVNASVAGGGLFHDLAPHQLDLMYYFFGEFNKATGIAINQAGAYAADDMVAGTVLFNSGVLFNGSWCFAASRQGEEDQCLIVGAEGEIRFSIFNHEPVRLIRDGKTETFHFDPLPHVQQPMIQQVVNYFLDKAPNPCTPEEGIAVMDMIDQFTGATAN